MLLFETPRILVREFQKEDLPILLKIYNCKENMQFVSSGKWIWSERELMEKIEKNVRNYRKGYGIYVVIERKTNKLIGEVGLFNSFELERIMELGYILDRNYWGKGFGTELLKGIISYGFDELQLKKMVARMYFENKASSRICEKCGMQLEQKGELNSGVEYLQYDILRG